MIRHLSSALAVSLCFAVSSLHAEEEKTPAEVQIEFTLSDGDEVVERAAVYLDLRDKGSSFDGTTSIKAPFGGGLWVIQVSGFIGNENTPKEDRELSVNVSDFQQLRENIREGTKTVWPVELFESRRVWHGPGTYRLADYGHLSLSAKVADTPALKGKEAAPAAAPAVEKR